jgi:hypothetical protein
LFFCIPEMRLLMAAACHAGNNSNERPIITRLSRIIAAASLCATTAGPALAAAPAAPQAVWPSWRAIIYQKQNNAQLDTLKRLGVTAGLVYANRDNRIGNPVNPEAARLARRGMRFYVENIATDFYSAYHRWRPDHPVNAAFLAAEALHRRAPADPSAFMRQPGLSDPQALHRITARLARIVREYAPYHPLYYSLADEPGIAELAANWDFDVAPSSLAGMRVWLRENYGSLTALNREWGTGFAHWADVTPRLTDAAVRQKGENFAAWADFKRWMDVAFARAVRAGTDAVHEADPKALAAIEGAQIPGWGGYNYTRLATAVDVMEIYDAGESIEIARSLNPALIMLMTFSGGDPQQLHQLWHSVLRGMRGGILWDAHDTLARQNGAIGAWGRRAAPVFAALRGKLGGILLNSQRITDPVATLYSPASLRTQWLLDRRAGGGPWENRGAEAEDESQDAVQVAMRRFADLLARAGLQGTYTAPRLIERGALRNGHIRLLLLPHVIALPAKAAAEIRRFVAHGGIVAADVVPGQFDQHSRRLPHPLLAGLFRRDTTEAVLLANHDGLPLRRARLRPAFRLGGIALRDVRLFRFRHGTATILALQRKFTPGAIPVTVTLHLPASRLVRDVRTGQDYGRTDRVKLLLDPVTPTILSIK